MTNIWLVTIAMAACVGAAAEAAATPVQARTQRGCLRIARSVALMQGYSQSAVAEGRLTARRGGVSLTVVCAAGSANVSASGPGAEAAAASVRAALRAPDCIDDCD